MYRRRHNDSTDHPSRAEVDLTDLHFLSARLSQIHQHGDLSPATDATRGAASASPTCSMRSVAAPRLNMLPFVVGVEDHDSAVVGPEKSEKHGDDDAMNHFLSTFRYCARAHEPAAPRHDMS